MAGEAIVGALRVILGMDTAQFEDGAKRAANQMSGFGTQMKAVFAGVGLERIVERVFSNISHAFKSTIVDAFNFADEMGKMAQKVGITVEELTGLRLAADLSDVSMETLSKSMGFLAKNMVAAASGNREMADSFARLGINVRDATGELKSPIQVLTEMADKFEETRDGALKVDAALKLLGRGGKDLIPLLNEGGNSLREFVVVAERMGLVISQNTANQTQKFNDNLKILKLGLEGIGNTVVKELIPGLLRMSEHLAGGVKEGDRIRAAADFITASFKQMVGIIITSIETIRLFDDVINIIGKSARKGFDELAEGPKQAAKEMKGTVDTYFTGAEVILRGLGEIATRWGLIGPATEDAGDEAKAFGDRTALAVSAADIELRKIPERIREFQDLLKGGNVAALVEKMFEGFATGARKAGGNLDDPLNKNMERFNDQIKSMRLQALDASGVFAGQLAPGFLSATAGIKALEGQITIVRDRMVILGPLARQFNDEMLRLQGLKLTAEFLDPWEQLRLKLAEIDLLLGSKFPISAETARLASVKAATEMATSYGQAAASIVGPVASAFKDLASMNKKYAGIAKAAAIAEALVNTYLGATKAFTSTIQFGFPIAAAAAAAATAAGLANVAKIAATEFAHGGSFKVGGTGGVDSQMVSFKATPGEMVDVRTPGQQRGGTPINVNIEGDTISRNQVRQLFDTLNAGMRDGYKLNLVGT